MTPRWPVIYLPYFRGQATSVSKTSVVTVRQISDRVQDHGEALSGLMREEACWDALHFLKQQTMLAFGASTWLPLHRPVRKERKICRDRCCYLIFRSAIPTQKTPIHNADGGHSNTEKNICLQCGWRPFQHRKHPSATWMEAIPSAKWIEAIPTQKTQLAQSKG